MSLEFNPNVGCCAVDLIISVSQSMVVSSACRRPTVLRVDGVVTR